ncbi:hypothetical protein Lesp01_66230 [Lentzea sp. NBRC 102530]|nr:hypothetical protein Lesp01_66230 [Lentzea sp. NBRC 102530]
MLCGKASARSQTRRDHRRHHAGDFSVPDCENATGRERDVVGPRFRRTHPAVKWLHRTGVPHPAEPFALLGVIGPGDSRAIPQMLAAAPRTCQPTCAGELPGFAAGGRLGYGPDSGSRLANNAKVRDSRA